MTQPAGFFGPQWIQTVEGGLVVNAENVALALLLKEWCGVCHQQCVVDHDIKQKTSVVLDKIQCDDLLDILSRGIDVKKLGSGFLFGKTGKGEWAGYRCVYRQASEIAALLKQLLSPMGKYEHVLADDVSGNLWVPERFLQAHMGMVEALDVQKPIYTVHLSWVHLNRVLLDQLSMGDKWQQPLLEWLMGKTVDVGLLDLVGWFEGLKQEGILSLVTDLSLLVIAGEEVSAKLLDVTETLRRDKKGLQVIQDTPEGVGVTLLAVSQNNGVLLNIDLRSDWVLAHDSPISQTNTIINTKVLLQRHQSVMVGGMAKEEEYTLKRCVPLLSQLPFLGRLFCRYRHQKDMRQYALVVTLI